MQNVFSCSLVAVWQPERLSSSTACASLLLLRPRVLLLVLWAPPLWSVLPLLPLLLPLLLFLLFLLPQLLQLLCSVLLLSLLLFLWQLPFLLVISFLQKLLCLLSPLLLVLPLPLPLLLLGLMLSLFWPVPLLLELAPASSVAGPALPGVALACRFVPSAAAAAAAAAPESPVALLLLLWLRLPSAAIAPEPPAAVPVSLHQSGLLLGMQACATPPASTTP